MATAPASWPLTLEPGLREIFTTEALGRPESVRERLYGTRPSGKAQESYLGAGAFGLFNKFEGTLEYDDMSQGWLTTIANPEFAKGFYVRRKWVDDEQYGMINEMARGLGSAALRTIEEDAADLFNKAFTSATYRTGESNLGGDGVVLCSASHPRSPKDSTTQSNFTALSLSLDNWETVVNSGAAITDDRGDKAGVRFDTILVPRALRRTAIQMFGARAVYEPGSAQFDTNPYAGEVEVIVWDRLTDTNAWFAIDSTLMRNFLIWQDRIPLEFDREGDFDGIGQKYRGYYRVGRGWSHWAWIHGCNP